MDIHKIATDILKQNALGDPFDTTKNIKTSTNVSTFLVEINSSVLDKFQDFLKNINGVTGFQPTNTTLQIQTSVSYDRSKTTPLKIEMSMKNMLKKIRNTDIKIITQSLKIK